RRSVIDLEKIVCAPQAIADAHSRRDVVPNIALSAGVSIGVIAIDAFGEVQMKQPGGVLQPILKGAAGGVDAPSEQAHVSAFELEFCVPLPAALGCDNVDCASHGVRAVQRRT